MRNLVLFFNLMLVSCFANAQDSLKFSPNSWATEVNVNLFNGEVSLNNSLNQIKLRRFIDNGLAYRLAFNIREINKNFKEKLDYGYDPVDYTGTRNSFEANVSFGMEKHFKGTSKLSPYIGWEFGVNYKTSTQTEEQDGSKLKITGCWIGYDYYYSDYGGYMTRTIYSERGYTSFGINAVAGLDFFLLKNIFVGFEFIYGVNYKIYQKIKIEDDSYPDLKESEFNFSPSIINGIRIGYFF